MNESKPRVLLGSPVRQKPEILKVFLQGIRALKQESLKVDYMFVDDNTDAESSALLCLFAGEKPGTEVIKAGDNRDYISDEKAGDNRDYICDEKTHVWEEELIWKVAGFKNRMIEQALQGDYDWLFLVDSDLLLHPQTLLQLISLQKDITAEIFWTRWEPDFPELPQVWASDQYNLYHSFRGEVLSQEEVLKRVRTFIRQLKVPGVYEVGGLGACTLISRKALLGGVSYKEIYNVSFIGEDRHFCIRAAALGFSLFVDTSYPAYHMYRLSDLKGVQAYREKSGRK